GRLPRARSGPRGNTAVALGADSGTCSQFSTCRRKPRRISGARESRRRFRTAGAPGRRCPTWQLALRGTRSQRSLRYGVRSATEHWADTSSASRAARRIAGAAERHDRAEIKPQLMRGAPTHGSRVSVTLTHFAQLAPCAHFTRCAQLWRLTLEVLAIGWSS